MGKGEEEQGETSVHFCGRADYSLLLDQDPAPELVLLAGHKVAVAVVKVLERVVQAQDEASVPPGLATHPQSWRWAGQRRAGECDCEGGVRCGKNWLIGNE